MPGTILRERSCKRADRHGRHRRTCGEPQRIEIRQYSGKDQNKGRQQNQATTRPNHADQQTSDAACQRVKQVHHDFVNHYSRKWQTSYMTRDLRKCK